MKKLVFYDISLAKSSPSLKAVLAVHKLLAKQNYSYHFCAGKVADDLQEFGTTQSIFNHNRLPWACHFIITILLFWLPFFRKKYQQPADAIHISIGAAIPNADIYYFHFYQRRWLSILEQIPYKSCSYWLHRLLSFCCCCLETKVLNCSKNQAPIIVVSESIKELMIADGVKASRIHVIANIVEKNEQPIQQSERIAARKKRAILPETTVFTFIAQGHFLRKGLWLALDALSLQQNKNFIFDIIGGSTKTISKINKIIHQKYPTIANKINLHGMQNGVRDYYAVSDGYFFPSYFEAFSLTEIEAALLGIPLFLTKHPGVEMILKDGVNGKLLSWHPILMAEQLFTATKQKYQFYPHHKAVSQQQFMQKISAIFSSL